MIQNDRELKKCSNQVLLKAIRVIWNQMLPLCLLYLLESWTFKSYWIFQQPHKQLHFLQVEKSMISINILSHNFTALKKLPLLNYFFLLFFISFETKWCLTHKKTENKYWFCYNLFIGHLHRNYLLFFEIIKICDFVEVFGYKNGHSPKIDRVLKYILRNKSLIGFRCFYLFLIHRNLNLIVTVNVSINYNRSN